MTKREIIMAKREGYAGCLIDELGWSYADAFGEATERYPTPKKKVPNIAHTPSGQYKIEDGIVYHRLGDKGVWREACLDLPDLQALARIVKAPFVEVEDMD